MCIQQLDVAPEQADILCLFEDVARDGPALVLQYQQRQSALAN
jgi:hypothetical protein